MHPLTDLFAIQALGNCRFSNHAGYYGLRCFQYARQPLALREG